MRFALLGSHPDGLAMAAALVATGRHFLAAYTGTAPAALPGFGGVRQANDLEEVLSDPHIDLVIVAGVEANRPAQLPDACKRNGTYSASIRRRDRPRSLTKPPCCRRTPATASTLIAQRLHPAVTRFENPLSTLRKGAGAASAARMVAAVANGTRPQD